MLKIATGFSLHYGGSLAWLAALRDGEHFNPTDVDLGESLDGAVEWIREEAGEAREFSLIRPWLEFLIACSKRDLQALGIEAARNHGDITLQHPGIDAMPERQWHHVFEYLRKKLFGVGDPMTEQEKERTKQEVTLVDESLDDFRKRMRSEGRLPDPEP